MSSRARTLLLVGIACVLVPVAMLGVALGVGWAEAFGSRAAVWATLGLLAAAVAWGHRRSRRLLPSVSAPAVRRALVLLQSIWSAQLLAVGLYGAGAAWWIARTLASPRDYWVLLPWAAALLITLGAGLLAFGWGYGRYALTLDRILDHDVAAQRRRVQTGAVVAWSSFEAAGCVGLLAACGTLAWWPFDLLGGGAIASLLVHHLVWCERLVDLLTHPPLVEPEAEDL